MNYYERYLGDYQRDTATLSLLEHGAYTMLLDTYYATEMPLPAEMARLYRVCRAVTAEEQAAVAYVVEQFFPVGPDGMRHNTRANEEIAKAQARIEVARNNGRGGGRPPKRKPPDNPAGNPAGNPLGNPPGNPAANPQETQRQSSPHAIHQKRETALASAFSPRADVKPSPAGEACRRLKAEAGVTDVNPSHGKLLAVLEAGATVQQLVDIAIEKRANGSPPRFAYVLSAMAGRLADAAAMPAIAKAQQGNVFAGAK